MRPGLTRSWGSVILAGVLVLATLGIAVGADVLVSWRGGPPSPFGFTRFDGETVREADIPGFGAARTFFLGGRQTDDSTSGAVWSFDGTTYTDTGAVMSTPISNYQIARLMNRAGNVLLYIFGGRMGDGTIIGTVQTYNPVTNATAALSPDDDYPGTTPSGCKALPAMGAAVVRNKAIVMGGIAPAGPGCAQAELTAQTWIFDPTASVGSRWEAGPDLTQARGYITPAVIGNTVYAIGGDVWSEDGVLLIPVATVESIKPLRATPRWHRRADLPVPCDESQAFGFTREDLANKIVLAGCGQWPTALSNSFIYDVATDVWTETDALLEARRNHAGARGGAIVPRLDKAMYVLGGYAADGVTVLLTSETSTARVAGASRALRPAIRPPLRPGVRYSTY